MTDVKILVKNVYAPAESQQFVVVDTLQVRALKQMLAAALPGNPAPKHQKLIFGGKICDDELTLARVLAGQSAQQDAAQEDAAPFVFHLMVSSAVPRSRPPTPEAQSRPAATAPTPAPAAAQPAIASPPTPEPATGGIPPAPVPQPQANAGFPFVGLFGAAAPTPATAVPTAAPEQQNHHHQLFQQAYLMQQQAMILHQIQYLQQLQAHHVSAAQGSAANQPQAQAHGMLPPFGHFGHHYAHMYGMPPPAAYGANHVHAAHVPGFPAPHVPGAQAPAAPAAEAPVAEPRERGPIVQAFREILPLFDIRLAMKMTFMLFIIGQDTPTDRLIVLALMSFGAYLHITGIVAKVFEILKRSCGAQGEGDPNAAQNSNDPNGNPAPNTQGRLGSITQYLRISSDRGFLHDVRYFITGLLLSLVPAWHPQPLNVDPAAPARPEPIIPDAGAEIPMQGI